MYLLKLNSEFVQGLGYGLGYAYSLHVKAFKRAEENGSHFIRGLGIGLGEGFPFLDTNSQLQLFGRAQENIEFAIGLGEGFGRVFVYLDKELREKILEDLGRDNGYYDNNSNNNNRSGIRNGNGFSRSLGIGLGRNLHI